MGAAHQGEEQPELRSEGLHWKSYPDKNKTDNTHPKNWRS